MKCNSEISCKLLPWIVFIPEGHKSMLPALSYKGLDTDNILPWWLSGKESTCQCRRYEFNPWVGKTPLEKEMATHSSILAWRISWTEEPDGLQSMGSRRVGHDLATKQLHAVL